MRFLAAYGSTRRRVYVLPHQPMPMGGGHAASSESVPASIQRWLVIDCKALIAAGSCAIVGMVLITALHNGRSVTLEPGGFFQLGVRDHRLCDVSDHVCSVAVPDRTVGDFNA